MNSIWKVVCVSVCFPLFEIASLNFDNDKQSRIYKSTSFMGMLQLLSLEQELLQYFVEMKGLVPSKTEATHLFLKQIHKEHEKAKYDAEAFFSNPLNGFSLIRRMHADWSKLKNYMNQSVDQAPINYIMKKLSQKPMTSDLKQVKADLHSIQVTYNLRPSDIANGWINGRQYNASLSAFDCYEMGLHSYFLESFNNSIDWMKAALDHYDKGSPKVYEMLEFPLGDVWLKIAQSFYNLDKFADALNVGEAMMSLNLQNNNLEFFTNLKNERRNRIGCRGEFSRSLKLHCKYDTTTSPILRIAPTKVEIIQESPTVVIYHDIIYDREIEDIKQLAKPHLVRAMVGGGLHNEDRTSSAANVNLEESHLAQIIHQRTMDVTGLDLEGSGGLHIVNYGLGGHYYNHVDYYNALTFPSDVLGDRKAIILFYLNDVEQGGATIFPQIEKAYFPKKGSAIFWTHLDNAANGDPDSLHAGCPILYGTKWVTIKLMYANPQMFSQPCLAVKPKEI